MASKYPSADALISAIERRESPRVLRSLLSALVAEVGAVRRAEKRDADAAAAAVKDAARSKAAAASAKARKAQAASKASARAK